MSTVKEKQCAEQTEGSDARLELVLRGLTATRRAGEADACGILAGLVSPQVIEYIALERLDLNATGCACDLVCLCRIAPARLRQL